MVVVFPKVHVAMISLVVLLFVHAFGLECLHAGGPLRPVLNDLVRNWCVLDGFKELDSSLVNQTVTQNTDEYFTVKH